MSSSECYIDLVPPRESWSDGQSAERRLYSAVCVCDFPPWLRDRSWVWKGRAGPTTAKTPSGHRDEARQQGTAPSGEGTDPRGELTARRGQGTAPGEHRGPPSAHHAAR